MDTRMPAVFFHHRDVNFESFTYTSERLLERTKFQKLVDALPFAVYRAKGPVCFADGCYLLDYVLGRPELERCPTEKTNMVFVGPHLSELRQTLLGQLEACEL